MQSSTPISTLPFVGPKYAQLLIKLGITTVGDLLFHLPRGYQDLSKITAIQDVEEEVLSVVEAELTSLKKVRIKGGKVMITGQVQDASGSLNLTWFNQPYIDQTLKVGQTYRFAGEVERKYGSKQMISPQTELASRPPVHTGRLVPIYPQTAGITSKWLRNRITPLLPKVRDIIEEYLPPTTIQRHQLPTLASALTAIHDPQDMAQATTARHRLAFDELLALQLANQTTRHQWQTITAPTLSLSQDQLDVIISQLPFSLTPDQHQVILDILANLNHPTPMNRLVQGDVGSGKTIVAFVAALVAVRHDYQVAILAPTSVLANQHYLTFQTLLASQFPAINQLTTNNTPEANFSTTSTTPSATSIPTLSLRTAKSKQPPADITVGTHALLSDTVHFTKLGLVIIDEQHRFGVEQRAALAKKTAHGVHLLAMTATPIPRTLALTAFGDLDVSTIATMPANRLPIKTHIVPQAKRQDMYPYISQAIGRGEQAYIICPLVEESQTLEVKSATAEFERLQTIFPNHKLALLHGRMKAADKDTILDDFKQHRYDILVATPVVEVGIDVPNATILVIEGAERFGLAQLHQLRGRVGRGDKQSYCFLLSDAKDALEVERLHHLTQHTSGIALAEIDLQKRGPGEVYGTRQSGIPQLKAATYSDIDLIQQTQKEAKLLLEEQPLDRLPLLAHKVNQIIAARSQ